MILFIFQWPIGVFGIFSTKMEKVNKSYPSASSLRSDFFSNMAQIGKCVCVYACVCVSYCVCMRVISRLHMLDSLCVALTYFVFVLKVVNNYCKVL